MDPRKLVESLCNAWDLRHVETGSHVRRIGLFSEALALALGVSAKQAGRLGEAAMLHDVGKIIVPDAILTKPGKLTNEEFEIMKRHTTDGCRMLAPIDHPFFQEAAAIALCHHERWDGSGYPAGLRGDDCPRDARIVGIVDVYDALSQPRCYKPAWSEAEVTRYFREASAKQFESVLVEALLDSAAGLRELATRVAASAPLPDVFAGAISETGGEAPSGFDER